MNATVAQSLDLTEGSRKDLQLAIQNQPYLNAVAQSEVKRPPDVRLRSKSLVRGP